MFCRGFFRFFASSPPLFVLGRLARLHAYSEPSDPTLFTNIINLPGNDLPTSAGGVTSETTQVNVANGVALRSSLVTAPASLPIFFSSQSSKKPFLLQIMFPKIIL